MITILVVDDHPLMRAGLQCMLDATDDLHVVAAVASGGEALEQVSLLHPDLVLLDLCMPGMDGVATARLLHERHPDVPVVVLTSTCVPALVQAAFEAGASGYLLKDMPPQRLLAALRGVPRGQRAVDPRASRILARLARRAQAGAASS